ncbi:MAG TPA: hypothetical protein VJT49_10485 [Amycolatopsis sp.]|uniref:hypothetical protein n=1 Tax=Amycolatopsis sp. TaxID=37632 RepID=UPI002B4A9A14|nr:hypothetical protein [Amycolatopsis sp.]HKS45521.1 hypothetical protein [Amycolatopsis sp.]
MCCDLAAHPELGRAIAAAGHEIGNHSFSPAYACEHVRSGSIVLLYPMYAGREQGRSRGADGLGARTPPATSGGRGAGRLTMAS